MEEAEVLDGKELSEAMDESIRSTLADIQSRNPDALKDDTKTDTPAEPVKADKPRDPEGKFTKKESATPEKADTPEKAQAAPAVDQAVAEPEAPITTTTGQPVDINRAPSSWKPANKALWATLPEGIRAEIHRRESNFLHEGKSRQDDAVFGKTIKQTLEPYRMLIESEGGSPEKAIGSYLRTAAIFRTGTPQQKLDTLFALDHQFNGGLNAHFQKSVQDAVSKALGTQGQQQPPVQQPYQDPRVDQLVKRLEQQDLDRQAEESRISNAATERFVFAKDDKGQPLYPFVDNVLEDMTVRVGILRGQNPSLGHEEILKQAYESAVWANPETRAVLISQQQAQANQPVETLRKVEQAKRASAVNVPKRGAIAAKAPETSLRLGTPESDESIRETFRQLTG